VPNPSPVELSKTVERRALLGWLREHDSNVHRQLQRLMSCRLDDPGMVIVDPRGIEPRTSTLRVSCCCQLSYGSMCLLLDVGRLGIEPSPAGLKGPCSTSELASRTRFLSMPRGQGTSFYEHSGFLCEL
jgi:hypothetical protein